MPWLIGAIVGALGRMFASRIGMWIAGGLLFMGIGLVSHGVVVGPILDGIEAELQDAASNSGAVAIQWMKFLNFDKAVTMIMSAYATRAAIGAGKVWLARR